MNIISWNTLSDIWINRNIEYKNVNNKYLYFDYRKKCITKILNKVKPFIILLQEIDLNSYNYFNNYYKDKYWISKLSTINWCAEDPRNNCNITGNIIMLKKNILNKLYGKEYKINEYKVKINTNNKMLVIKLKDILIINIHLSTIDEKTRIKEINNILKYINKHKNKKIIIGGDFNNDINKDKKMDNILKKSNFNKIEMSTPTYIMDEPVLIDFIYYKNMDIKHTLDLYMKGHNKSNLENLTFKLYGSDHLPVIGKITNY
jgi:endonuclease/exonuclease/phosphatase family metal-dependent hydrolase